MSRVISQADLLALRTGYETQRDIAQKAYVPQLQDLARMKNSGNKREAHPMHALNSEMSRWSGDRKYTDVMTKVVYITNQEPWQIATAIQMSDLELGADIDLDLIANRHGRAAAARPDALIKTAIQGGASSAWVDGKNFFAVDHPVSLDGLSATTWANLFTLALTPANFETVFNAMTGLLDWDGLPINFDPGGWVLTVPTARQNDGLRIVEQEFSSDPGVTTAGGNSNVNYKKARLRVCSLLNDEPTAWYLSYESDVIKPVIVQTWRATRSRQKGIGSDTNFDNDSIHLGVDTGVEAGLYEAHYIARSKP